MDVLLAEAESEKLSVTRLMEFPEPFVSGRHGRGDGFPFLHSINKRELWKLY